MADNIGDVELGVGADLTGFAASLRAKAEKAIAKAEAKISDLNIDVDIDDAKVLTGVRKMRAEANLLFAQLGKINVDGAGESVEALAVRMARVDVLAAAIDDKYAGISKKIVGAQRATKLQIDFEKQWRREMVGINSETDRVLKTVSRDLVKGWRAVANTTGDWKRTLLEVGTNIKKVRSEAVKLDGTAKSIKASFLSLARSSHGGGGGRGGFLSKSTFSDPQASMASLGARALALTSLFGPLGGTVSGLAASLVAVTGAIGLASGAMITGTTVVSALGGAFIALKIGMSGVGDAIKGVDGAMEKLTPSAREFVKAVKAARPEWKAFQKSIQEKLFEGLGKEIGNLAENLLPKLTPAFSGIASELNKAAKAMSQWATSNEGIKTLTGIIGGMRQILKTLLPALGNIGKGLATLWAGSMPQAKAMSSTLLTITQRFAIWTKQLTAGGATSKFSKFLKDASTSASALLSVIGSLGGLLRRVFGAGADEGVGLLNTFDKLLDRANKFFDSAEGQRSLEKFFDTISVAAETFSNVADAATPVVRALLDAFGDMAAPMKALRKQLQPILQLIGQKLAGAIKSVVPLLQAFVEVITTILSGINALPGPIKGVIVQIGLALVIVPKLTAAFAAARLAMISGAASFGIWGKSAKAAAASAAAAGTSVSRFGKLSGLAAGAAGLGLLSASTGKTDTALGQLARTGGLVATGFAVGGPLGAGIGAVAGAALTLKDAVVNLNKPLEQLPVGMNIGREASRKAALAWDTYRDAIIKVSGETVKFNRRLIGQKLIQSGMADAARETGISLSTLISATTGNEKAFNKVERAAAKAKTTFGALENQKLLTWISKTKNGLDDTTAAIRRNRERWRETDADIRKRLGKPIPKFDTRLLLGGLMTTAEAIDTEVRDINRSFVNTGQAKPNLSLFRSSLGGQLKQINLFARGASTGIGGQMGAGVISGLMARAAEVARQARELVRVGVRSMNDEAEIRSPSKVTMLVGKFMAEGVAKGLAGDRSAVDAVSALMNRLTTRLGKAGEKAASTVVQNYRKGLLKAAGAVDGINAKIESAVAGLKAAHAEFRQFAADTAQAITSSFALAQIDLTEILPADQFDTILARFKDAATASAGFTDALKALAGAGLRKDLLAQFVEAGPAALAEMQAILASGGVGALNALQAQIAAASKEAGLFAAKQFKTQGIEHAKGILQGLRERKKDLVAEFRTVARNFVEAIIKNIKDLGLDKLLSGGLNLNRHASGTLSSPGGLSLVGEEGPELMRLPRRTRVWNNGDTRRMLSSTTESNVVVNQNFYGPTTSGGRLRELDWTVRFASAARAESTAGVATA